MNVAPLALTPLITAPGCMGTRLQYAIVHIVVKTYILKFKKNKIKNMFYASIKTLQNIQ